MNKKSDPATATIRAAGNSTNEEGRFIISGTLGFDTAPDLMKQAKRLFTSVDAVVIDFSGVDNCNSAGLAVVIEIAKTMRKQNKTVCFRSLPEQIRTFARAYSVEKELSEAGILC